MKNLNPDKKIIYILNKYGYKKDVKTSRVCRDTDYYRKGTIENNDLEIVAISSYTVSKGTYRQEIIVTTFDNCYLMGNRKAAMVWKASYYLLPEIKDKKLIHYKDYFNIESMSWYLDGRYRDIIEDINTRLYKLKEEGK